MEIFHKLFKRKPKKKWEVLKLYSSVSDDRPSTIDRKQLVDELLRIYSDYYKETPKLFDIDGPYSISKGRPVGLKRFNNLLDKNGYERFHRLTMADKEHTRYIYFTDNAQDLKKRNLTNGYQELIFAQRVPYFSADLKGVALDMFKSLKYDYGYITYLPENFEILNEAKLTRWLGSISTTHSPADMTWRKNTGLILDGEIKDVYEFNILNQKQTEKLIARGYKVEKFNERLNSLELGQADRIELRNQIKKELLINTVPNISYKTYAVLQVLKVRAIKFRQQRGTKKGIYTHTSYSRTLYAMPQDNMKKNYPDMRILDETDKYFVGHIFEDAYLVEKRNGEEIVRDDFYGDPNCGLISKNNDWAIIAGEHLTIWTKGKTTKIDNEDLRWVYALRTNDQKIVEVLIDPWTDKSAIWTLDIATLRFKKIKDFDDYKEKEHTDEIVW